MSKVITTMNMKGGVGKTTVAMHLAGMLANHRFKGYEHIKKILMIDYDPQFNLSQAFIPPKEYFSLESKRLTTLAILTDDDDDLDPYVLQVPGNHEPPKVSSLRHNIASYTDGGRLDIIPATLDLMYLALGQATTQIAPIEERFGKFIDECRKNYDLIIIDCHPAGSIFTKTSLRNSDFVLIPVAPERYALRGIGLMLRFINGKKTGSTGPSPLILFNRANRVGISTEETSIRANTTYGPLCLTHTLKRYSALSEPEAGSGFVWKSKKPYSSEATHNLVNVCAELLRKFYE